MSAPKKPSRAPERPLSPAHVPVGPLSPRGLGPQVLSIGPCRAYAHPHPTRSAKTTLMVSIRTRVPTRRTAVVNPSAPQ